MKKYRLTTFVIIAMIVLLDLSCGKDIFVNSLPQISSIIVDSQNLDWEGTSTISVVASDPDGDNLTYSWTCSGGTITSETQNDSITWQAPRLNGDYICAVTVSDNDTSVTENDTLYVRAIPVVAIDMQSMDFGNLTESQKFVLSNTGNGQLTYTITKSADWLTLSSLSGSLVVNTKNSYTLVKAAAESEEIIVTVDRAGLANGSYTDQLSISSNGGDETMDVTMEVAPELDVSAGDLDFGTETRSLFFDISNVGSGTLSWSLSKSADWLAIDLTSGQAGDDNNQIKVTADRSGLADGTYTDQININSDGGSAVVNIEMRVVNPVLSVSKTSLDFGNVSTTNIFTIGNTGGDTLTWELSKSADWLTLSPTSGLQTTKTQSITAVVDRSGLSPGSYSDQISVSSNGGSATLDVTVVVDEAELAVNVDALDFGAAEDNLTFTIENAGNGSMSWTISKTADWLVIDPVSGNTSSETDEISVSVERENLEGGTYTDQIVINSTGGDHTIDVEMQVAPTIVVGTWEGEYTGYDPQTSNDLTIRRRLRIYPNATYSDTLWGQPASEAEIIFQWEIGEWELNEDESVILFKPAEAERIDISSNELESWDREEHEDNVELSNDNTEWMFRDDNLEVEYTLQKQEGATTTSGFTSRHALVSIANGGEEYWSVQFSQNVDGLQTGVEYKITFDAYADRNVTIMCDVNQGGGSYQQVLWESGVSPLFDITTTKTTFSKSTISTIEDEGNGISALQFNLGQTGSYDIYIDNVSVKADGVELITNGDFSSSIATGWDSLYLQDSGDATVTIIDP